MYRYTEQQKYSKEALDRACRIAHEYNLLSYRQIKKFLHNRAHIIEDEDRETRHTATIYRRTKIT